MKLHEFQSKQIIAKYGVITPQGIVAKSVSEAKAAWKKLDRKLVVVKAQIHAGGRGKAGGVKLARSESETVSHATEILGKMLITPQTGKAGQEVKTLLIEEGVDIAHELYLSILIDRETKTPVILASTAGGMDIEEVAERTPELIYKEHIDPLIGLRSYHIQRLCQNLNLQSKELKKSFSQTILGLYQAFCMEDCSLLEINPLIVTKDDRIVALDCKIALDDNAMYRQPASLELRDMDEEEPMEIEAAKYQLNYIKLDGNIGCMVNGAGLAMATMDIIKLHGGEPANFLDVGGNTNQENVEAALKIIFQDKNVKCVLINIFGGIVRGDMIAQGIVAALTKIGMKTPIVVRLQGNRSLEAHQIIAQSEFKDKLIILDDISMAAKKTVELAR